jgi:hypothetical protein
MHRNKNAFKNLAECASITKDAFPNIFTILENRSRLTYFCTRAAQICLRRVCACRSQKRVQASAHVLVQWANHCASIKAHNNFIIL